MKSNTLDRLSMGLVSLLTRLHDYCRKQAETTPLFGLCIANPKHSSAGPPSREIKIELEKLATEHFRSTAAVRYYFRYWTPPILPEAAKKGFEVQ